MCGIAGIFNANSRGLAPEDAGTVERMLLYLRHRGPDASGIYVDNCACLGHARLSIIDLEGGAQPMSNEDGSIWLTFNGEIFNYLELREDLVKKGHVFKTVSDTEVIIHLFEDHGEECLKFLNGQFAFALWDRGKGELFLARDRFGIRPLFYARGGGRFFFASEIKAVFASGAVKREIDPASIDEVFTFWTTAGQGTAFASVYELPPAHSMVVKKDGSAVIRQYWDIEFSGNGADRGLEESSTELMEALIDATRLQLRADVPVGAYLSGGLDSTAVVALIRNFTSSRLETFSISFEDLAYDEGGFQDQVSKAFGTANHKIRCSYKDIRDAFPEVIWHAEKPILRTAPAPLYLLSRLVREKGLKVVLTGEGADEVMGGYDIFRETKIREFWAREPLSKARPLLLKRLYPYLPRLQGSSRQYMEAFFGTGIEARDDVFFSHRPRWATTAKTKVFFSNDLRHRLDGGGPEKRLLMSLRKDIGGLDPVQRAEYLEIKNLLPGYILSSQGDRVSMAHSIEGRFPFLDHRVAELTARLPGRYKIRGLDEKHILKTSMKALLPESIIKRKKQPYLAPEARSFFEGGRPCEYAAWLLSGQCITRYGYFDPKAVSMLLDKCMAGRAAGFRDNMAFVGILSTQMLHRLFIEDFRQEQGRLKNLHIINGEENASRQGV